MDCVGDLGAAAAEVAHAAVHGGHWGNGWALAASRDVVVLGADLDVVVGGGFRGGAEPVEEHFCETAGAAGLGDDFDDPAAVGEFFLEEIL